MTPQSPSSKPRRKSASRGRYLRAANACSECRKRKVRCDGQTPCSTCVSRDIGSTCCYHAPRDREYHSKQYVRYTQLGASSLNQDPLLTMMSHPQNRNVDKLAQSLEEHQSVLGTLFPSHNATSLLRLSRESLIQLMLCQSVSLGDGREHEAWRCSPPVFDQQWYFDQAAAECQYLLPTLHTSLDQPCMVDGTSLSGFWIVDCRYPAMGPFGCASFEPVAVSPTAVSPWDTTS